MTREEFVEKVAAEIRDYFCEPEGTCKEIAGAVIDIVLEEAVNLADAEWTTPVDDYSRGVRDVSENIAKRIRALKGEAK